MANVFISWSGPRSYEMAKILYEWIPQVIQAADPWFSAEDIDKGARWNEEIAKELDQARLGILCLVQENQDAPWILFEAGALAKTVDRSLVCTYLLDLECSDVRPPLSQFNHTTAEKEDTRKLIFTINKAMEHPVKNETLNKVFEKCWPELAQRLAKIPPSTDQKETRSEGDMIREILDLVRGLARQPVAVTQSSERKAAETEGPPLPKIRYERRPDRFALKAERLSR